MQFTNRVSDTHRFCFCFSIWWHHWPFFLFFSTCQSSDNAIALSASRCDWQEPPDLWFSIFVLFYLSFSFTMMFIFSSPKPIAIYQIGRAIRYHITKHITNTNTFFLLLLLCVFFIAFFKWALFFLLHLVTMRTSIAATIWSDTAILCVLCES